MCALKAYSALFVKERFIARYVNDVGKEDIVGSAVYHLKNTAFQRKGRLCNSGGRNNLALYRCKTAFLKLILLCSGENANVIGASHKLFGCEIDNKLPTLHKKLM